MNDQLKKLIENLINSFADLYDTAVDCGLSYEDRLLELPEAKDAYFYKSHFLYSMSDFAEHLGRVTHDFNMIARYYFYECQPPKEKKRQKELDRLTKKQ